VNEYANLYWKLSDRELKPSRPPKVLWGLRFQVGKSGLGQGLQMVRAARRKKGPKAKPVLRKVEFEFDETLFTLGGFHYEGI